MIAANDDPETLANQRAGILAEFEQRGTMHMDKADLGQWIEQTSSILATWLIQDGLSLRTLQSGDVPEQSMVCFKFYRLNVRVVRAHNPDLIKLALAAAQHLMTLTTYGQVASKAAARDAVDGFRKAIRHQAANLPDWEVEELTVALIALMQGKLTTLLREKVERLQAEIIDAGGTPLNDGEPPSDR